MLLSENLLKKILFPLMLTAALALFLLPVFAAETVIVPGADSTVYLAYAGKIIDNFHDIGMGWTNGENMDTATVADTLTIPPYAAFSDRHCLVCQTIAPLDGDSDYTASAVTNGDYSIRGRSYGCFGYVINLPETLSDGKEAKFNVTVTLSSPKGDKLLNSPVTGGAWTAVFCDISSWDGRSQITGITFAVKCVSAEKAENYVFAIDDIALFDSVSAAQSMRWLVPAGDWYPYPSSTSSSVLRFTPPGESFYIETYNSVIPASVTTSTPYLCMRLDNRCSAQTIRMEYAEENSSVYLQTSQAEQTLYDGDQTVYFQLPKTACSRLRFRFDGAAIYGSSGYIDVISIYPTNSSGCQPPASIGEIVSCTADSFGNVTVSGTLSDSSAQEYAGYDILLIESGTLETAQSGSVIASVRVSPRFTLSGAGGIGYVADRYTAVINYNSEYLPIGSSYLSNPEDACDSPGSYTDIFSSDEKGILKGVSAETASQAAANSGYVYFDGAAAVVIPVRIERLFSMKMTSIGYTHNGTISYFDPSYVQQIDNAVSAYRDSGAAVWLRLTVSKTKDNQLSALLCSPLSLSTSGYSAFNTDTYDGLSLYQTIFSFIAERWSKNSSSPVSGYIIGSRVNDSFGNWHLGSITLDDFTKSYSSAVRQAYLAMRAAAGDVGIAISVDGRFEDGYPSDIPLRFPAQKFISAFSRMISSEGDFEWMIELSLDADQLTADSLQSTAKKSSSGDRIEISADNYELMDDLLKRAPMMFRTSGVSTSASGASDISRSDAGSADESAAEKTVSDKSSYKRSVMISVAAGVKEQDYVYSFYKLSTPSCDSAKLIVIPGSAAAEFRSVFNGIDTPDTLDYSQNSLESLGASGWSELISDFDSSKVKSRSFASLSFASVMPEKIKGSYLLNGFDTSDHADTVKPGPGCTDVEIRQSFSNRTGLIMANLSISDKRVNGGIYYKFGRPLDLSQSPILTLDCTVVSLPENTDQAQMTIMFVSGRSAVSVSGQISENGWQRAICDLTGLGDSIRSVDGIRIWLSSYDDKPLGTPSVIIDSLTVWSQSYDDSELSDYFQKQYSASDALSRPIPRRMLLIPAALIVICLIAIGWRAASRNGILSGQTKKTDISDWKYD